MLLRVMSLQPQPNFHAKHWHHRPAWQAHWHALDTHFDNGQAFLDTLLAWKESHQASSTLFYTAFAERAPVNLIPELRQHCFGLLPGIHRISFEQSKVHLTLCIGPVAQNLKDIDFAADSIFISNLSGYEPRQFARLCKLGTFIHLEESPFEELNQFKALGFVWHEELGHAVYQPHWKIKTSVRFLESRTDLSPQKAIVIGAGLAGAAVAHSLAKRGWQVDVIDQHTQTGGGASGLPAGLFATHVSPDNNVLSKITRDGVRATVQRAASLLQMGKDWDLAHLLEHRYSGKRELPAGDAWPPAGLDWSSEAKTSQKVLAGLLPETQALWHPMAGWIQVQALVKAQLSHPQINCLFGIKVSRLVRDNSTWQLFDAHNQSIATSNLVVIANAHECQDLLNSVSLNETHDAGPAPFIPVTPLRGQVTYGNMNLLNQALKEKLPPFPVNGHGSYIGNLPSLQADLPSPYWIIGSSFQRFDLDTQTRSQDQLSNLKQWAELMPAWHDEILESVDVSAAKAWAGIRAALPDRLPAVGAFQNPRYEGLQVCTGMGARGISWSVLCGELLAAQVSQEPLPMSASLAKLMSASRFG